MNDICAKIVEIYIIEGRRVKIIVKCYKNLDYALQGVVASGIAFAVQTWCVDRGGPVFVAVYQPVQTLVVAIMASLALGEEFYLGGFVLLPLLFISLTLFNFYFYFFISHAK